MENIQDGYIVFTRAKTERTTRTDPRPITVYITEEMQRIIEEYGCENKDSESSAKEKSLIALAVAHAVQCPYCF